MARYGPGGTYLSGPEYGSAGHVTGLLNPGADSDNQEFGQLPIIGGVEWIQIGDPEKSGIYSTNPYALQTFGGARSVVKDPTYGYIVPAKLNEELIGRANSMSGDGVFKALDAGVGFWILTAAAGAAVGAAAAAGGGATAPTAAIGDAAWGINPVSAEGVIGPGVNFAGSQPWNAFGYASGFVPDAAAGALTVADVGGVVGTGVVEGLAAPLTGSLGALFNPGYVVDLANSGALVSGVGYTAAAPSIPWDSVKKALGTTKQATGIASTLGTLSGLGRSGSSSAGTAGQLPVTVRPGYMPTSGATGLGALFGGDMAPWLWIAVGLGVIVLASKIKV